MGKLAAKARNKVKGLIAARLGRERTGAEGNRWRVPACPLAFLFRCLPFYPTA